MPIERVRILTFLAQSVKANGALARHLSKMLATAWVAIQLWLRNFGVSLRKGIYKPHPCTRRGRFIEVITVAHLHGNVCKNSSYENFRVYAPLLNGALCSLP